ncbi:MAG TPA: hypothetical protein VFI55_10880, partial [Mycobacterium sp.]|nr:hypothetical protein [Mycobacterium sp.]
RPKDFADGYTGVTVREGPATWPPQRFVGPLLGSLARIDGGRPADRDRGSRVTLGVLGGILLFVLSGMGYGSMFTMIPSIYEARSQGLDVGDAERRHWSYLDSGTKTWAYRLFPAPYIVAAILTWMSYVRERVPAACMPADVLTTQPPRM